VRPTDNNDIRESNIRWVLDIIRDGGAISRVDIAHTTQLSRSTITNIVNDLLPTGLIQEMGTVNSIVGRRPILLEFNYAARIVLGVDMGATHLIVVAMNLGGKVLSIRREFCYDVVTQPDKSLTRILELLQEVQEEAAYPPEQVLGVGIGVPAPLEGDRLDRLSPIILPQWTGLDLRREVGAATRHSVFLDNDANMGALAEKWWGHGRNVSNFAFIKLGTGVGCGLIISGAVYRGEGGTAGEIGHTAIDPNGPLCRCGLYGCLEALTGSPAILDAVHQQLRAGQPSSMAGDFTVEDVAAAARAGDPVATNVITTVGHHLGIAIANLLNLVNPGLIVLWGGITEAGDLLLTQLRQSVRERSFSKSTAEATITTSRLGEDAIAIGAATLVIEQVLRSPDTSILEVIGTNGGR
jgi:predicted NBD/HSP70 family sugar kinase